MSSAVAVPPRSAGPRLGGVDVGYSAITDTSNDNGLSSSVPGGHLSSSVPKLRERERLSSSIPRQKAHGMETVKMGGGGGGGGIGAQANILVSTTPSSVGPPSVLASSIPARGFRSDSYSDAYTRYGQMHGGGGGTQGDHGAAAIKTSGYTQFAAENDNAGDGTAGTRSETGTTANTAPRTQRRTLSSTKIGPGTETGTKTDTGINGETTAVGPVGLDQITGLPAPDPFHEPPATNPCCFCFVAFKFLFSVFLIPIRLILLVVVIGLLWFFCKLLLIGATVPTRPGHPPLGGVRSWLLRSVGRIFARLALLSMGFWVIERTYLGDHDTNHNDGQLVVANHIGYVDVLVLLADRCPSFVAKKATLSLPFIGSIAAAIQCVFVDRGNPASRVEVMRMIDERATDKFFPPLLIFPEGTTTNGQCILTFQRGAFFGGHPVKPIALKCNHEFFNPAWSSTSGYDHFFGLIGQFYNRLELFYLPLYVPNIQEQNDSKLFARNVQIHMCQAAGVVPNSLDLYDSPFLGMSRRQRAATQTKLLKIDQGLVEGAGTTPAVPTAPTLGPIDDEEARRRMLTVDLVSAASEPLSLPRRDYRRYTIDAALDLTRKLPKLINKDALIDVCSENLDSGTSREEAEADAVAAMSLAALAAAATRSTLSSTSLSWSSQPLIPSHGITNRPTRALTHQQAEEATRTFWRHRSSVVGMIAP